MVVKGYFSEARLVVDKTRKRGYIQKQSLRGDFQESCSTNDLDSLKENIYAIHIYVLNNWIAILTFIYSRPLNFAQNVLLLGCLVFQNEVL